jgi:hypothetical protein
MSNQHLNPLVVAFLLGILAWGFSVRHDPLPFVEQPLAGQIRFGLASLPPREAATLAVFFLTESARQ